MSAAEAFAAKLIVLTLIMALGGGSLFGPIHRASLPQRQWFGGLLFTAFTFGIWTEYHLVGGAVESTCLIACASLLCAAISPVGRETVRSLVAWARHRR